MELTDRRRRFAFAGIVVALTAVGVYLTMSSSSGAREPVAKPSSVPVQNVPASSPVTPAAGAGTSASPGDFDIYRLLPFSRGEFATAGDLARRFTAAYGTYRYDEDPQTYLQRVQGMVTDELRTELQRGASAPGLIEERKREQVVAVGDATLDSIRDIENNSVIFVVTAKQQITKAGQQSQDSHQYAVTVVRDGSEWKVYSFEPADVGQAGDTG